MLQPLPLKQLHESPTNPWHGRDDVTELAANIDEVGVLQPLLVRLIKPRHYEVVCGNRRLRACTLAGLATVPVIVRELTDKQALEAQLAENCQRVDVHPMEECTAFERLMTDHGYGADDIAETIGKSRSHVYGRLKYSSLSPKCRKAFLAGEINPSVALLLARIPVAKLQDDALKDVTEDSDDPMSARAAQQHVRRHFMLALKDAPFKVTDAELTDAGPCNVCPKRTGAQPELFADVDSADVCTDPECFAAKKAAHGKRLIELHKSQGGKVLSKKASAELFPNEWDRSPRGGDYVDLREQPSLGDVEYGSTKKSWKGLVGAELKDKVVLAVDKKGEVRELVPRAAAKKVLAENHPKLAPAKPKGKTAAQKREEAKKKRAERVREVFTAAVIAEIVSTVEDEGTVFDDYSDVLRLIAEPVLEAVAAKEACERRGIEVTDNAEDALRAALQTMTERQIVGVLLELACRYTRPWHSRDGVVVFESAAELLDLDLEQIEAYAEEQVPPVATGKGAKAATKKKGAAK